MKGLQFELLDKCAEIPKEEIGRSIQLIRESKRMNKTELGKASGLNPTTIHSIEIGKNRPRRNTLLKICHALDCRLADLMDLDKLIKRIEEGEFIERNKIQTKIECIGKETFSAILKIVHPTPIAAHDYEENILCLSEGVIIHLIDEDKKVELDLGDEYEIEKGVLHRFINTTRKAIIHVRISEQKPPHNSLHS